MEAIEKKKGAKVIETSVSGASVAGTSFKEFTTRVASCITDCKNVKSIETDEDNQSARNAATEANKVVKSLNSARLEVNKPLNDQIKSNNEMVKNMLAPLEAEITRLKGAINVYETEKENARQKELQRIEAERLEKEKAEQDKIAQLQKLKDNTLNWKQEMMSKISECKTLGQVDKIEAAINKVKVTKKEYAELKDFVAEVKNDLLGLVKERREFVKNLKKVSKDEKALELEKKAQEDELAQKEREISEQNEEIQAKQELITLVASLQDSTTNWKVDEKIDELINKYGTARNAILNREQIVLDEAAAAIEAEKEKAVVEGKVKNQRKEIKFRVLDPNQVPREYMSVDEKKIREAIAAHRKELNEDISSFSILGVSIFEDTQTVLK